MQRIENDIKPCWKKIHVGNLTLVGRRARIKYKEVLRISEEELGKYRDQFELLEDGTGKYKVSEEAELGLPAEPQTVASPVENEEYHVKQTGGGWYNVESGSGKVMNQTKLRRVDAEELKSQLEEQTIEN